MKKKPNRMLKLNKETLRTLTDHLVTIPNSTLVNESIENVARRRTLRRLPRRARRPRRAAAGNVDAGPRRVPGPARTPRPVLEKLNGAVTKILHSPDVAKKFAALGLEPVGQDLAATDAYMKSEIAKWAKVVKAANIAPN